MNGGLSITIDRSAEFKIDALVRVTVPAAGPLVRLSATFGGITSTHTGATHMAYTLPADKMVKLQIAYVDGAGNPAVVDGAVVWDTSDDTIAHIDPMTPTPVGAVENGVVMLVPGKVGNCQITARADADLGAGVRELITLMDVTVVGGEAVAGTITPVGDAIPKP
jgi:hypothetical protein